MGDVFSELIGQERAVATLRRAVEGRSHAMSHAWLFCAAGALVALIKAFSAK